MKVSMKTMHSLLAADAGCVRQQVGLKILYKSYYL